MAENKVGFELVSPERLLVSEAVEMVVVPGSEGDFGVLPRHTPMISTLRPGLIRIYAGGQVKERIFVAGGFVEVMPERCTVLADQAVAVADIDRAEVEGWLKDAREDLVDAKTDDERQAAQKRVAVGEAMLQVAER